MVLDRLRVCAFPPSFAAMVAEGREEKEAQWLQMALRAATTVGQNMRETRALRWQAMEVSRLGWLTAELPVAKHVDEDAIDALDMVLAAAQEAIGATSAISLTQAKDILRKRGAEGAKLASALSVLSKARNRRAHPQANSLAAAVRALLRRPQVVEVKLDESEEEKESLSEIKDMYKLLTTDFSEKDALKHSIDQEADQNIFSATVEAFEWLQGMCLPEKGGSEVPALCWRPKPHLLPAHWECDIGLLKGVEAKKLDQVTADEKTDVTEYEMVSKHDEIEKATSSREWDKSSAVACEDAVSQVQLACDDTLANTANMAFLVDNEESSERRELWRNKYLDESLADWRADKLRELLMQWCTIAFTATSEDEDSNEKVQD